jgi:hypothetical protein
LHEHIGEAEAINSDGSCTNPDFISSFDQMSCYFKQKTDVFRHFMLFGGVDGLKERRDGLLSRTRFFSRNMFNLTEYPIVQQLFDSDSFKTAAKSVCPKEKQFLDPFQFNIFIQVIKIIFLCTLPFPYTFLSKNWN